MVVSPLARQAVASSCATLISIRNQTSQESTVLAGSASNKGYKSISIYFSLLLLIRLNTGFPGHIILPFRGFVCRTRRRKVTPATQPNCRNRASDAATSPRGLETAAARISLSHPLSLSLSLSLSHPLSRSLALSLSFSLSLSISLSLSLSLSKLSASKPMQMTTSCGPAAQMQDHAASDDQRRP